MTKTDFLNVIRAIETIGDNEIINCRRMCEKNPAITEERERDRDLILYALMMAQLEIEKRFPNIKEDNRK